MSREIQHNPIWNRLKDQLYKLQGCECPDCHIQYFPPREICQCGSEINQHTLGNGTVTAIFDHKESDTREIEVNYIKNGNNRKLTINLNGKSHSLKVELNAEIGIIKRFSKEKGNIYDACEAISSSSK